MKTDEEIRNLMIEASKTPEGIEILKQTICERFPVEYADVMNKIIDGNIELNEAKTNQAVNDNILDNFNANKRSKEEMELLFRGKLSPEETTRLKENKKLKRKLI